MNCRKLIKVAKLEDLGENNVHMVLEIEDHSAQLALLEEKHRADRRELVELEFQRFRDCNKKTLDRIPGVQLRLVQVSPLHKVRKEGNLVDGAFDKVIVRLS